MISARHDKFNRMITNDLPQVGEMIDVKGFGPALVEKIYNNDRDNFIRVQYQETLIGPHSATYSFRVDRE